MNEQENDPKQTDEFALQENDQDALSTDGGVAQAGRDLSQSSTTVNTLIYVNLSFHNVWPNNQSQLNPCSSLAIAVSLLLLLLLSCHNHSGESMSKENTPLSLLIERVAQTSHLLDVTIQPLQEEQFSEYSRLALSNLPMLLTSKEISVNAWGMEFFGSGQPWQHGGLTPLGLSLTSSANEEILTEGSWSRQLFADVELQERKWIVQLDLVPMFSADEVLTQINRGAKLFEDVESQEQEWFANSGFVPTVPVSEVVPIQVDKTRQRLSDRDELRVEEVDMESIPEASNVLGLLIWGGAGGSLLWGNRGKRSRL